MDNINIIVASDSIGETAQRMIHATLTQFPDLNNVEIKKFPYIKDEEEFLNILKIPLLQILIIDTPITSLSHFEYLCNIMVLFSSIICYDVSILKFWKFIRGVNLWKKKLF